MRQLTFTIKANDGCGCSGKTQSVMLALICYGKEFYELALRIKNAKFKNSDCGELKSQQHTQLTASVIFSTQLL